MVLHGFAGHAESWRDVVAALPGRRVEAITLFGHDHEHPARAEIAFDDEVARVVSILRKLGGAVRLCGYSMGGRVTLGVLARAPELVASALLVGANPGLSTDEERTQRAASDAIWAELLEREPVAVFAEKWQAQALFATQRTLDPERLAGQTAVRLRHDPRSLAMAMRSLGLARMPSYWSVLETVSVPIDFVVGALDTKFVALATRMSERVPAGLGRVIRVDGAGHNVLLERPELLAALIGGDRTAPLPSGASVV